LHTIDVKGSVLDIGGSQNPIKGRTKSWLVDNYKILDLEQPHECKQKPDIVADIQEDYTASDQDIFDNIFCIEVSEYWYDPIFALNNIHRLLKKDGLLFISFHFIYPQHKPIGTDFLRYTPIGAEKLLQEAEFEILENIPRLSTFDFIEAWQAEGMRGWKDFDSNEIGSLITARKI
jgi:SAM-dependent methyltransferase